MKKVAASGTSGHGAILVAYFSHSGNTHKIADMIHMSVESDLFEIQTVKFYPREYAEVVMVARLELKEKYLPDLKTKLENIALYQTIFVGYPCWWGTIPRPVAMFLSSYDFSGKTIVPFCTHEGSGFGRSVQDIQELCPKSTILDGLEVRGSSVENAGSMVSDWLRKTEMIE